MASVRKQQLICEFLDVIQPFVELEEKSKFSETLEVTEGSTVREDFCTFQILRTSSFWSLRKNV